MSSTTAPKHVPHPSPIEDKPKERTRPYPDYKPLRSNEIRLPRLLPGVGTEVVQCEFFTVSLDEAPPYETISYVWGEEPQPKKWILVKKELVTVTINLFRALHRFRQPNGIRWLWADALCINQRNTQEKDCQVALMGKIYTDCYRVLISLDECAWQPFVPERWRIDAGLMQLAHTASPSEQFRMLATDAHLETVIRSVHINDQHIDGSDVPREPGDASKYICLRAWLFANLVGRLVSCKW